MWVAPRAEDYLDAGLRHALDEDAVESDAALARDVLQLFPRGFELIQIGDAQDNAANIALMRRSGRLQLGREREAERLHGSARFSEARRKTPRRHFDAERGKIGLARGFG